MAARSTENIGVLAKKTENFNIMRRLALVLFTALLPGVVSAQVFRINYDLQSTDLPPEQVEALGRFLASGGNSYFLVQGFACDTGGFAVSVRIADQRARKAHPVLLRSVAEDRLRFALPTVLPGEPRVDHRKLLITAFPTLADLEKALRSANEEQALNHQRYSPQTIADPEPNKEPFPRLLVLILVLAVLAVAWIAYTRLEPSFRKRKHQLTEPEAAMVQAITGEAPVSVPKSRRPSHSSPIQPHDIVDFRSTTMAAKKKTQKAGLSIRKAVDKSFEGKSLGEIARSPIHALQGLTPRHSKMLEEAFGVKTVEDLAGLRYFELARAITVLSRYEE